MSAVHGLALRHPNVWASAGQHPEAAASATDWIAPWLTAERVVAVGETGLDYHYQTEAGPQQRQRQSFAEQMQLAANHQLPVIIHTRSAVADTLAIMRDYPAVNGVLHCFTESWEMAEQALALGYCISLSGIVTFRNAQSLRDVAARVPLDRLLIETDAPWLAPMPHRGATNAPALLPYTAELIAGVRDMSLTELARATTENFQRLFQVHLQAERTVAVAADATTDGG